MTDSDLTTVKDGRVFSGAQAFRLHLVDELGYLNDAVQWAKAAAGVKKAQVIIYYRPGTYVDNIYSKSQAEALSWVDQLQQGELLPQRPEPRFMYLWQP